jgi:hypothetical protein
LRLTQLGHRVPTADERPGKAHLVVDRALLLPRHRSTSNAHSRRSSVQAVAAVPVDLRAVHQLKSSPLALDLYTWLTHRMSHVRRLTLVPWKGLQAQLGADYARPRDFRRMALARLEDVVGAHPELRIREEGEGLRLAPSPLHFRSHSLKRESERCRDLVVLPRQRVAPYPTLSVVHQTRTSVSPLVGECSDSRRPKTVQ